MISKPFSKERLDDEEEEQKEEREIRKTQISQAIEQAMTSANGTRCESFNLLDLAVQLKILDLNDLHDWTYDLVKKEIESLVHSGTIIELETRKKVPSGG